MASADVDTKERFSGRVDEYVRYRPGYPRGLFDLLVGACGLHPGSVVADVGSGTGILSGLLIETGANVFGVEPNAQMRAAAERAFAYRERFTSVAGSAEATTLRGASVDAITAGQAFHWFDPKAARTEFSRILAPHGWVVLTWNRRRDSPLDRDFEEMLARYAPDYAHVRTRDRASEGHLREFFAPVVPAFVRFDNEQRMDEEGFRGRLVSTSYAPREGDPLHEPMMRRLEAIHRAHAVGGLVTFAYDTETWYGRL